MKRTRRFKRVAAKSKPKPVITRIDDAETRPSQRFESAAVRAKPEPNPSPFSVLSAHKMTILPSSFFQIDALDLAPRLLGKFLRRDDVVLQITEVIMLFSFSVCLARKFRNRDYMGGLKCFKNG